MYASRNIGIVSCVLYILFGHAVSKAQITYQDCSASHKQALIGPCRHPTIKLVDKRITLRIQRLLKFDHIRYKKDDDYKTLIDRTTSRLLTIFNRGVEVEDEWGLFGRLFPDIEMATPEQIIQLFKDFPTEHAGCNLTRETQATTSFSRSFIFSYFKGRKLKFAVMHLSIPNPQSLHRLPPSLRKTMVSTIEIFPVVPGSDVSNALLRTHVVKNQSASCRRILDKMDQKVIRNLRKEAR